MRVVKLLHKQLQKNGSIHKKRLASLFDIVETAMQTQYVTLTELDRRLSSSIKIKHKIKKEPTFTVGKLKESDLSWFIRVC